MNHLRTAAQQALEALYEADTFHRNLPDQRARRLAAMAALRAALAQHVEPVVGWMDPASGDVIRAAQRVVWNEDFGQAGQRKAALFSVPLRAALAQQAEPVPQGGWHDAAQWLRNNYQDHPTIAGLCDAMVAASPPAPPQRKPLTEEEIDRICAPLGFAQLSPVEVARAVERAHGIKE